MPNAMIAIKILKTTTASAPASLPDKVMDGLNLARGRLETSSDAWSTLLEVATVFVVMGVIVEVVATWLEVRDEKRAGHRIKLHHVLTFVGAGLIALAVGAEGLAEYKGVDVETKLRGNNAAAQGVLTNRANAATADAVALTKSFGGLHDFVTDQENLNTAAREELQRTTDALNKARDEALAADKDAKQTAAAIAAANAPREFSKDQHDRLIALFGRLPAVPASQFVVYSVVANREAERYANVLSKALSDAHLNLLYVSFGHSTCLECVGVWVGVQPDAKPKVVEDGKPIRDAFAADGVNVAPFCTQSQLFNTSTLVIIVGPKS